MRMVAGLILIADIMTARKAGAIAKEVKIRVSTILQRKKC